jgi:hypothetical protein
VTPKRWLLTILSFSAAIGASAWIVWSSWPTGDGRLALPLMAHLVALGGAVGEVTLRAFKLTWSAKALEIPLTVATAYRVCLGGDFGASVTPSRSGAEPARFLIMAEAKTPLGGIVMVLWAEIVLEVLSLATVALLIAMLFPGSDRAVTSVLLVIATYAMTVLALSLLGLVLSRKNANGPPPTWATRIRLNSGRWRVIQKALRQLRTSVAALRHAKRGWVFASFMASVFHVISRLAILPWCCSWRRRRPSPRSSPGRWRCSTAPLWCRPRAAAARSNWSSSRRSAMSSQRRSSAPRSSGGGFTRYICTSWSAPWSPAAP